MSGAPVPSSTEFEDRIDDEDYETCSWCTAVRPWDELDTNEMPDGALVCDVCAQNAIDLFRSDQSIYPH